MLEPETNVFLGIADDTGAYCLRPGKIIAGRERRFIAKLEENDFEIEAGQETFVYYENKREFVKQAVLVEAVEKAEIATVDFELQGKPESAESRQCYRASTVIRDMSAKLVLQRYEDSE